jgi:hypothetical protein
VQSAQPEINLSSQFGDMDDIEEDLHNFNPITNLLKQVWYVE